MRSILDGNTGMPGMCFKTGLKVLRAIEKDSHWLECGRYIERNPLNAGMVKDPLEYPWSSYSCYGHGGINRLVTMNPLYLDLAKDEKERRTIYRKYILTERPYEEFIDHGILGGQYPSP